MPSQKQVRWSQLKVGLTVVAASITLAVLIFLMNETGGWFTGKIILKSYFDNASGLRPGATVELQGVDIGNVKRIAIVPQPLTPVEVTMKVNTKFLPSIRKDSVTSLETAGVLGATFVEIDSSRAKKAPVQDGDVLETREHPDIQDVVRASQGTLQNLDTLLKRLDRIVTFVESGQGSIGKLIYDEAFYQSLNDTLNQFRAIASDVSKGRGSLGKLVVSDELYQKANTTVDQLNTIVAGLEQGKGTFGKFLKDPALYDNANQIVANIRQLSEELNAGKGALGKMTKDPEFAARLENTINKLSSIADRLDAGQGTVGRLLRDASLYQNTDQVLLETRGLIKAIREDPKRYLTIHLRIF